MKVIRDDQLKGNELKGVVLTLGNFDGVHLGHQAILKRVVERARGYKTRSMVFTFEPHPLHIIAPQKKLLLITTLKERERLIESFGIDILYLARFTLEFASQHPEEFLRGVIHDRINPRLIVVGHDYAFGRGKEGRIPLLRKMGKELGYEVEVIPPYRVDSTVVSSSIIRECILKGGVARAAELLGRYYSIKGEVVKGSGRGRSIGFPTANVMPEKELLPARGVYATHVNCGGMCYKGVTNIGYNPTFSSPSSTPVLSVEAYIFDFEGDLYGETIELHFVERIRDESRFKDPSVLVEQIERDISMAKDILIQSYGW